jgi:hypothetical protein
MLGGKKETTLLDAWSIDRSAALVVVRSRNPSLFEAIMSLLGEDDVP